MPVATFPDVSSKPKHAVWFRLCHLTALHTLWCLKEPSLRVFRSMGALQKIDKFNKQIVCSIFLHPASSSCFFIVKLLDLNSTKAHSNNPLRCSYIQEGFFRRGFVITLQRIDKKKSLKKCSMQCASTKQQ